MPPLTSSPSRSIDHGLRSLYKNRQTRQSSKCALHLRKINTHIADQLEIYGAFMHGDECALEAVKRPELHLLSFLK